MYYDNTITIRYLWSNPPHPRTSVKGQGRWILTPLWRVEPPQRTQVDPSTLHMESKRVSIGLSTHINKEFVCYYVCLHHLFCFIIHSVFSATLHENFSLCKSLHTRMNSSYKYFMNMCYYGLIYIRLQLSSLLRGTSAFGQQRSSKYLKSIWKVVAQIVIF